MRKQSTQKWNPDFRRRGSGDYAREAKIDLRRRVLDAIGRERAIVFDAFAGAGAMYRAVWRDAAGYVGCDTEWYRDERCLFVADNRRVLRAIDVQPFTCFDLDAWGSPWEQALIIAARRRVTAGERIGLVITDGTGLNAYLGGTVKALWQAADLDRNAVRGSGQLLDEILARAMHGIARRMRARVVRHWRAGQGNQDAKMRYASAVLEGV